MHNEKTSDEYIRDILGTSLEEGLATLGMTEADLDELDEPDPWQEVRASSTEKLCKILSCPDEYPELEPARDLTVELIKYRLQLPESLSEAEVKQHARKFLDFARHIS